MGKDRVAQAWTQGFDAGTRLLPSSGNPYTGGSDLHEAWFDGWCHGSEPDQEDMEGAGSVPKGARGEKHPADAPRPERSEGGLRP